MKLHLDVDAFNDLIPITARFIGIPEDAVRRDYYIVLTLQKLERSECAASCVFKGGTSLSKCYPGTIMRFSEDIDLTYIPVHDEIDKQINKKLKHIEQVMSEGAAIKKIPEERNARNKSAYIWFDNDQNTKIKLEIGSSVRPDPFDTRQIKSYIHEYLESCDMYEAITQYELEPVNVNALRIERTFLDKVMAVKRHAMCKNLKKKVRHIYDVTMLMERPEIKAFLSDKEQLKHLVRLTKETDSYYLEKRHISKEYNPLGNYGFKKWEHYFDEEVRAIYEELHLTLLYTDEPQSFDQAIDAFREINAILEDVGE